MHVTASLLGHFARPKVYRERRRRRHDGCQRGRGLTAQQRRRKRFSRLNAQDAPCLWRDRPLQSACTCPMQHTIRYCDTYLTRTGHSCRFSAVRCRLNFTIIAVFMYLNHAHHRHPRSRFGFNGLRTGTFSFSRLRGSGPKQQSTTPPKKKTHRPPKA